jgi:predicted DCC family thiol-disulfide oxidoreductase YuxK
MIVPLHPEKPMEYQPVLIFDGICRFCNFWVRFVFKRDKECRIKFAHLQSGWANDLIHQQYGEVLRNMDSVLFLDNGIIYTHMDAVKQILKTINHPLRYGLSWIPNTIGHQLYVLIASVRYKIFGKSENCIPVSPEMKNRFIADQK